MVYFLVIYATPIASVLPTTAPPEFSDEGGAVPFLAAYTGQMKVQMACVRPLVAIHRPNDGSNGLCKARVGALHSTRGCSVAGFGPVQAQSGGSLHRPNEGRRYGGALHSTFLLSEGKAEQATDQIPNHKRKHKRHRAQPQKPN